MISLASLSIIFPHTSTRMYPLWLRSLKFPRTQRSWHIIGPQFQFVGWMNNYKSPKKKVSYFPGIRHMAVGFAKSGTEQVASGSGLQGLAEWTQALLCGQRARGDVTAWAHTGAAQSRALLTPPQKPQCDPEGPPWPAWGSSFLHLQTMNNMLHSIVRVEL